MTEDEQLKPYTLACGNLRWPRLRAAIGALADSNTHAAYAQKALNEAYWDSLWPEGSQDLLAECLKMMARGAEHPADAAEAQRVLAGRV